MSWPCEREVARRRERTVAAAQNRDLQLVISSRSAIAA